MKKTPLLFVLFIVFGISSCGVQCTDPQGLVFYLNGYDSTDLQIVIVRQFEKNGTFSKSLSTSLFCATTRARTAGNDTTYIKPEGSYTSFTLFYPNYADVDHDYTVEIPSANRIYKVKGISIAHGHTPNADNGCTNAISYYLDGVYKTTPQHEISGYEASIKFEK